MKTVEMQPPAPLVEIRGNVDPGTGDVESPGDVVVHGQVTDARSVHGAGDVVIHGSVESAQVHAERDLSIGGAAVGREKCRCVAGRDLTVRQVNGASLEAGRNVTVHSHVSQARIVCGGRLEAPAGCISGGHVTAAAGVACRDLGTPGGVETLVEAGIDQRLRRLAAERLPRLRDDLDQLAKKKMVVAELVRHQKGLTPGEKERATELLYEIEELEEAVRNSSDELRPIQAWISDQKAEIRVQNLLHAGTVIRIGLWETRVTMALKGPLSIVCKKTNAAAGIVAMETDTGASQPLPSVEFHDADLESLNRLLNLAN